MGGVLGVLWDVVGSCRGILGAGGSDRVVLDDDDGCCWVMLGAGRK